MQIKSSWFLSWYTWCFASPNEISEIFTYYLLKSNSSLSNRFAVVFPRYDIKCSIMQISGFYRVKKHPPHSKRGGYFFIFGQNLNLMTLADPAADQAGRGDMAVIGIHGIQCPVDSGNQFVQRIYQFLIAPGTFPQTDQKFSGCLPRPFMPRPHTAPADQNAEQAPGGIPFPPKERTQP